MRASVLLPLLLVACASNPASSGAETTSTESGTTEDETETGNEACEGTTMSTLPGVAFAFPSQPCTFTLAQAQAGVTFAYDLVIDAPVELVTRTPQDGGGCDTPDASGLTIFGAVTGNEQHYCLCDTGVCPPPDETPVTLPAGTFPEMFSWPGVNWSGPSDTNNPYGPPFPVGDYELLLTAVGTVDAQPYEVRGSFPITLVP